MKIILATCGSRGDVQPMIALTIGLKSAGHDALLLGPPEKANWAEKMECPYMAFGKDVTAFINNMEDAISIRAGISFVSFVRQEIHSQFKVLPSIIKNADLLIGSSLVFGLSSLAQAMSIKYRFIAFTPLLFPSHDHPFMTVKTQTLPLWCNDLSWKITSFLDRFNTTFLVNQHRKRLKLPPVSNIWDHILGDNTILACDKEIATVPLDVKQKVNQTGYLHLDLPDTPQSKLNHFFEAGSKPIYAGFGSMPPIDQARTIPLLIRAARRLEKRIIIARFWEEKSQYDTSPDVFFIKNYPHNHLFPRTAAAIHHGGAGTTATAALAGVPQIIVPHILDQYYHGQKIYLSGLGPRPISRSALTVDKLTLALKECFSSPEIFQAAEKARESIVMNNSINMAVQAVEQSFSS